MEDTKEELLNQAFFYYVCVNGRRSSENPAVSLGSKLVEHLAVV